MNSSNIKELKPLVMAADKSGVVFYRTLLTDWLTFNGVDYLLAEGQNIEFGTVTGTQIGASAVQKLSFYGATPVVRQAATVDLKDALTTYGLITGTSATPLNLDGGLLTSGGVTTSGHITIADAKNIILDTTTGTKIGTSTTQKLAFYNSTPVVQQPAVTDLKDALTAYGLITGTSASPLNLDGGLLTAGTIASGTITLADAANIVVNATTGTKIGTATTQKLGFFNATPIVQPAALIQTYSTADATLSAYTSDPESVAYTGIDNAQAGIVYATAADLNTLRVAYETLRVFTEDLAAFTNSLIDKLQALGLAS